jgi:hypothetical protein
MFSDKLALWMFWQFMGLINIGGVVGCVISEDPWVFVGLPNAVEVRQAFLIVFYVTLNPICNNAWNKFTSLGVALTQFFFFHMVFFIVVLFFFSLGEALTQFFFFTWSFLSLSFFFFCLIVILT